MSSMSASGLTTGRSRVAPSLAFRIEDGHGLGPFSGKLYYISAVLFASGMPSPYGEEDLYGSDDALGWGKHTYFSFASMDQVH
jgi:hypothetical protein